MGSPGGTALRPAGWFCTRRRRSSSTARTRTGVATFRSNRSISSATHSGRGERSGAGVKYGVSFLPAASPAALKAIRQTIRRWELHHRSDLALEDLAREYNPYIRGWINYYSHFYKSALVWTLRRVDAFLIRWARNKFKRLRLRPRGTREWFARVVRSKPTLFAHWEFLHVGGRTSGAV